MKTIFQEGWGLIWFHWTYLTGSHFTAYGILTIINRNLMLIPDWVTWQRAFNIFQPLLKNTFHGVFHSLLCVCMFPFLMECWLIWSVCYKFFATHTHSVEWAGRDISCRSLAQLQALKLSICAKIEGSSTVVFMREINLSPHWITRVLLYSCQCILVSVCIPTSSAKFLK